MLLLMLALLPAVDVAFFIAIISDDDDGGSSIKPIPISPIILVI